MQQDSTLQPDQTIEAKSPYPTLVKRIQSIFIDAITILLAMFAISAIIDRVGEVPDWLRAVLFIALCGVYEPLSMAFGCTLGNYIMGIRVRKASDEKHTINIFQSYLRFILKFILGWLSFITIHTDRQRRAIHDLGAGSVMIEVNKK